MERRSRSTDTEDYGDDYSNENTNGKTEFCLEVHDLAISKLAASRPKDAEFVSMLVYHEMISCRTMRERLTETDLTKPQRDRINLRIAALFEQLIDDRAFNRSCVSYVALGKG